ncbi:MAG: GNAT family N-acetyltransferase [Geminicoccaceae bacterium]
MSVPVVGIAGDEAERHISYAIRTAVFVDEQGVPLDEELDEHDAQATHLLARIGGRPVGTLRWRVVPPDTVKIERVAVLREARGSGLGRMLIEMALQQAAAAGFSRAVLNAQAVAVEFYRRLGFVVAGEPFDEAGIPHVPMQLDIVLPKTD